MFSIVLNIVGTLFHLYVAARLYSLDAVRTRISRRVWWIGAFLVWLLYFAGVRVGDEALDWRWWPGQFALTWLGITFVMSLCLLVADVVSGFGFWWRAHTQKLRALGTVAGLLLAAFALFQGMRAPVIVEQEVVMKDLPRALDGTVIVAVSDIHLGAQRRSEWLAARVDHINALKPAAVLMLGDQVEDNPVGEPQLAPTLRGLHAPWGVWAVTGNHEYYGDAETTVREFEEGGVRWLRDRQVELAPGLILAGIEDVGRAMRMDGDLAAGVAHAIPEANAGATILMSHTPAAAVIEAARARGVDLMLSGHTHGGQIWPFNYAVQHRFAKYAGAYDVDGMLLYVTRGAGSCGPRMRLWRSGEIIKLRLRSPTGA